MTTPTCPGSAPLGYLRVQEAVVALVQGSHLGPGAKIPSERALAEQLGLSRMTVRQGMQNLVRAGILKRDGKTGTRVAPPSVVRVMDAQHAFSMSRMIRSAGAEPGSKLLAFGQAGPDEAVRQALVLVPESPVITIRRLRSADGHPICIETTYLPALLVPGLAAEDLSQNASLYELLESRFGLRPGARRSEISVAAIETEDAKLLGVEPGINVLLYRSTVCDASGVALEHVLSINHPKRVVFSTDYAQIKL